MRARLANFVLAQAHKNNNNDSHVLKMLHLLANTLAAAGSPEQSVAVPTQCGLQTLRHTNTELDEAANLQRDGENGENWFPKI